MSYPRKPTILLLALDVAATVVVFNLASYLRGFGVVDHIVLVPLTAPVAAVIFALYLIEGYRERTDMLSVDYASLHAIALFGAMLMTLLLTFAFLPGGYELQSSRFVIAVSFIALIPLSLGYRRFLYLRTAATRGGRSLVFFGNRDSCQSFREECRKMGTQQPVIFTVVGEDSGALVGSALHDRLRPFREVLDEVQQGRIAVEAIILRESAQELSSDISERLVQLYFGGVPTYTLELFHQIHWRKIPLYRLNQTWLFQEGFQIAREPVFEHLKRVSDIVLATLGLLVFSPLIVIGAGSVRQVSHILKWDGRRKVGG